jgi:uncharacterized protein (TIGR02271 family)
MSRTVTALYDTKAEAEAARDRLSSEVDVEGRAKIIDQSSLSDEQHVSDFHSVPLSSEDREAYGEGLRRGGFMLCAEVDEDEDADKIVSILEQTSSVDLDERQNSWRRDGWAANTGIWESSDNQRGAGDRENVVQEERIPVIEEQLRVGKREEQRGGARVRTYVEERPVTEQVNLREEHVSVERRPVDQEIPRGELDSGGLLEEREVEMRETTEEAVVGKEARVKEEVVLQKTAHERTEKVEDTVRNTKVEVDQDSDSSIR